MNYSPCSSAGIRSEAPCNYQQSHFHISYKDPVNCVVLCIVVCRLCCCMYYLCVKVYYCHRVSTQMQLNIFPSVKKPQTIPKNKILYSIRSGSPRREVCSGLIYATVSLPGIIVVRTSNIQQLSFFSCCLAGLHHTPASSEHVNVIKSDCKW